MPVHLSSAIITKNDEQGAKIMVEDETRPQNKRPSAQRPPSWTLPRGGQKYWHPLGQLRFRGVPILLSREPAF